MQKIHILALTHRFVGIQQIGVYHLSDERRADVLHHVKVACGLDELMYLSTCNRVEFLLVTNETVDAAFISRFFVAFFGSANENVKTAISGCELFSGEDALRHIFNVASSLDSLVVGEREIITQVREAYEQSQEL